jgi:hypothetical protein
MRTPRRFALIFVREQARTGQVGLPVRPLDTAGWAGRVHVSLRLAAQTRAAQGTAFAFVPAFCTGAAYAGCIH